MIFFANIKTSLLTCLAILLPVNFAFGLTLQEALIATYENNPQIKAERASLAGIDEGVSQAISGFRPTIVGSYEIGRERTKLGADEDYEYGEPKSWNGNITQPIFNGFESIGQYRASKSRVMSGRARLISVEQDALINTVITYMNVVRDTSLLELSKNNYDVLKKQYDAVKQQFDVGEKTRTDVAQASARVSNAKTEIIQARGNLQASKASFERVTGIKPVGLIMPKSLPELPNQLESVVESAVEGNPNIIFSKNLAEATEHDITVAKASIYPDVSISASISDVDDSPSRLSGENFRSEDISLTVSVPLYQSGAEYSNIRRAKQSAQESKFDLQNAKDQTVEDSARAWESYITSKATIRSTEDSIEAAEIALDGVKQEAQYGARTTLDVLDAEQELFIARVNLVRAQRDEVVAAYGLLSVMGKMTAENLGLAVDIYDETENYDRVKYKFLGW